MKPQFAAIMSLALAAPAMAQTPAPPPAPPAGAPAPAPAAPPPTPEGPMHVVTYYDFNPATAKSAEKVLRAYRDATAKEAGATSVALYKETSPLARYVVDETWKDFGAYTAHSKTTTLGADLKAGATAPLDIRVQREWMIAPMPAATGKAWFGYTHIDVNPPNVPALEAALKPYVEKSRAEKGSLRFDVMQCLLPCRNHYTLAEGWASEADFTAHETSAQAVDFREKIAPLLGALYDHRMYKAAK